MDSTHVDAHRVDCQGESACQGAIISYGHTTCRGPRACVNTTTVRGGNIQCVGDNNINTGDDRSESEAVCTESEFGHVEVHCHDENSCQSLHLFASALFCHVDYSCKMMDRVESTSVVCLTENACPSMILDDHSTCSGVGCPDTAKPFLEVPSGHCQTFCEATYNHNPMRQPEQWFEDFQEEARREMIAIAQRAKAEEEDALLSLLQKSHNREDDDTNDEDPGGWYSSPAASKSSFLFTHFGNTVWMAVGALLHWIYQRYPLIGAARYRVMEAVTESMPDSLTSRRIYYQRSLSD